MGKRNTGLINQLAAAWIAVLLLAALVGLIQTSHGQSMTPDAKHTPGAPDVVTTQKNMTETICPPHSKPCDPKASRWTTKCVRPPAAYTNKLKDQQLGTYYADQGEPEEVEEDHLIPLTLGGCPICEDNLWPQPRAGTQYVAADKDKCEVASNKLVCTGKVPLIDAQKAIAQDWIAWCKKIGVIK